MIDPYADGLDSLTLIEAQFEGIRVVAALPNQWYDPAKELADSMTITFEIIGRPGALTVNVVYDEIWPSRALLAIAQTQMVVESIYVGADSLETSPVPPPPVEQTPLFPSHRGLPTFPVG